MLKQIAQRRITTVLEGMMSYTRLFTARNKQKNPHVGYSPLAPTSIHISGLQDGTDEKILTHSHSAHNTNLLQRMELKISFLSASSLV